MEPVPVTIEILFEEYISFFFKSALGKAFIILLLASWVVYGKYLNNGDWRAFQYYFQGVEVTTGILNAYEVTQTIKHDDSAFRVFFSYKVDGRLYFGDAFTEGHAPEIDQTVKVEYLVDQPYVSRIEGTQNAPYSALVFLGFIIPIVGIVLGVFGVKRVVWMARLLNRGYIAKGMRVKKGVVKKASINPWVKISYVCQLGNSSFVCHKWTTQPLNYREKETIIFTDNPSVYAMLCKDFSKSIVEYIERTYEISKK